MTAPGHLLAGFLLLAMVPAPGAAARSELPPRAAIQAWLDSWEGLAGSFRQELSSPTLPAGQVEAGTFAISRPDRMRWDYTVPESKLAMTDGESTWLYLPADNQVIVGRLETLRRDGAVALLLSGTLKLEEAFRVTDERRRGGGLELDLVPAAPSETISRIELRAAAADGAIVSFTVHDPAGNSVLWSFTDLRRDPPLPAGRFTFAPPAGVEVQDLEAMDGPLP